MTRHDEVSSAGEISAVSRVCRRMKEESGFGAVVFAGGLALSISAGALVPWGIDRELFVGAVTVAVYFVMLADLKPEGAVLAALVAAAIALIIWGMSETPTEGVARWLLLRFAAIGAIGGLAAGTFIEDATGPGKEAYSAWWKVGSWAAFAVGAVVLLFATVTEAAGVYSASAMIILALGFTLFFGVNIGTWIGKVLRGSFLRLAGY